MSANRPLAGISRMAGYALSMVILGVASLALIPAFIRSGGAAAWGAIALGQSFGAVAAVVVAYGWGLAGPARIAEASPGERRAEFLESLRVRLALCPVTVVVAGGCAAVISPNRPTLAIAGAASMTAIGLSANWYFVGVRRPYVLLITETVPRALGSVVGALVLTAGYPVITGVIMQAAGTLGGFATSSAWILRSLRGVPTVPVRPLKHVLAANRHGITSTLASALYVALPMSVVALIAPGVQPVYALADKVQRQVSVALNPAVTVLQGWVPGGPGRRRRAQQALIVGAALSAASSAMLLLGGPLLVRWLGNGRIQPSVAVVIMMSVFVGINLFESVVARAVLAPFNKLAGIARATLLSSVVGLGLVAAGASGWGAFGALTGLVVGLSIRATAELVMAAKAMASADLTATVSPADTVPLHEAADA